MSTTTATTANTFRLRESNYPLLDNSDRLAEVGRFNTAAFGSVTSHDRVTLFRVKEPIPNYPTLFQYNTYIKSKWDLTHIGGSRQGQQRPQLGKVIKEYGKYVLVSYNAQVQSFEDLIGMQKNVELQRSDADYLYNPRGIGGFAGTVAKSFWKIMDIVNVRLLRQPGRRDRQLALPAGVNWAATTVLYKAPYQHEVGGLSMPLGWTMFSVKVALKEVRAATLDNNMATLSNSKAHFAQVELEAIRAMSQGIVTGQSKIVQWEAAATFEGPSPDVVRQQVKEFHRQMKLLRTGWDWISGQRFVYEKRQPEAGSGNDLAIKSPLETLSIFYPTQGMKMIEIENPEDAPFIIGANVTSGEAIIYDFNRRTNAHWLITGAAGFGKSMLFKIIMIRYYTARKAIGLVEPLYFILDPSAGQEYAILGNLLGLRYEKIRNRTGLDPIKLNTAGVATDILAGLFKFGDDDQSKISKLALYVKKIKEADPLAGVERLPEVAKAEVERLRKENKEDNNMTVAELQVAKEVLEIIEAKMEKYRGIFEGEFKKGPFIVNTADPDYDDDALVAVSTMLLMEVKKQIHENPGRHVIIGIDEMSKMAATPSSIRIVSELVKEMRKSGVSVIGMMQELADAQKFGDALINNVDTVVVMHNREIDKFASLFKLTGQEIEVMKRLGQGECLIHVGSDVKMHAYIVPTAQELQMFDTKASLNQ